MNPPSWKSYKNAPPETGARRLFSKERLLFVSIRWLPQEWLF